MLPLPHMLHILFIRDKLDSLLSLLVLQRVFFPAGASQGLSSLLVLHRVFFHAGASQGLLSLLVFHRVFFPYWYFTGCSFPAGASYGWFPLLVFQRVFFACWCFTGSSFPAATFEGPSPKHCQVLSLFCTRGHCDLDLCLRVIYWSRPTSHLSSSVLASSTAELAF